MINETFPAIGHTFEANFGEFAYHLKFETDGKTMRFTPSTKPDFLEAQAVTYRAIGLRPGVFQVTWKEADGTTVTHIEDFEQGFVHTNITQPSLNFVNLSGSWKRMK
jgi:hypothetical protein